MRWPKKENELIDKSLSEKIKSLVASIERLEALVEKQKDQLVDLDVQVRNLTEVKTSTPKAGKTLHKVEEFNGEQIPEQEDSNLKMTIEDKIVSMRNAIKILPPNLKVNGKHHKSNIEAICGFKVSDELYDAAYEGIVEEV